MWKYDPYISKCTGIRDRFSEIWKSILAQKSNFRSVIEWWSSYAKKKIIWFFKNAMPSRIM